MWWATRGKDQPILIPANSLGIIDTNSGQLLGLVAVSQSPTGVAADGTDTWVVNTGEGSVSRIDQQTRAVVETVMVGQAPVALAVLGPDVGSAVGSVDGGCD